MHWPYSIISFLACWFDNIVYENMFQCTHECIPTLSCVLIYLRYVLCYHYDSLPKTCQNMYCPFSTTVGYLRSYAENWTFNLETIMWPDENKCIVCKIHIDHRIEFLGFVWLALQLFLWCSVTHHDTVPSMNGDTILMTEIVSPLATLPYHAHEYAVASAPLMRLLCYLIVVLVEFSVASSCWFDITCLIALSNKIFLSYGLFHSNNLITQ